MSKKKNRADSALKVQKVKKKSPAKKGSGKKNSKPLIISAGAPDVTVEMRPMPYDENLLERARMQWQFGDWLALAQLDRATLQHHPDRPRLALLAAAGHAQLGQTEAARNWLRLAQDWGCSRELISRVMISGVHNTLGRAALVSELDGKHAWDHFQAAIGVGMPGMDSELLLRSRVQCQIDQMPAEANVASKGLLPSAANTSSHTAALQLTDAASAKAEKMLDLAQALLQSGFLDEADTVLASIVEAHADHARAWTLYAECAMQKEDYQEAIRRWQALAAVLGDAMPQEKYDRLSLAYARIKSYPKASEAEEALRGDQDKHALLMRIHQALAPEKYLEIGVQTGKSLALAQCPAIGVDPMPQLRFALGAQAEVIETTSDNFFAQYGDALSQARPDLVFIDGMHLYEFALRDFINAERHANPHTLIVIDDILPGHPAQAERERRTRAWTGDVWKLHAALQAERPDLFLLCLDAYPTGLLLIAGLDPQSQVLDGKYQDLLHRYSFNQQTPPEVIARANTVSCQHEKVDAVLRILRTARETGMDAKAIRSALHGISQTGTSTESSAEARD